MEMKDNKNLKENKSLEVTSLSQLQEYAKGNIVRLPNFSEGQPFVARMRRPSMMVLAKSGRIPNELISVANEMFMGGGQNIDMTDPKMLANIFEVCEVIAEASLIEPTYADVKNTGLTLSDDQFIALFNYSQNGVEGLKPFLEE